MDIKVYKDGSKIKSRVLGLTLRQFLALLLIAGVTGLMMLNTFVLHINEIFFQIPIIVVLFAGLFITLVKINGLTGDRWLKLKVNYLKKPAKRTYQTGRIVEYERKDFTQPKKTKETAPFVEDGKAKA